MPGDRRSFLRLVGVGGLATLAGVTFRIERLAAAGDADALLLSCMDYRLVSATEQYMDRRGLRGKYDHVILAGAALGATTSKYPDWNQTFWEHLDTAIQLHQVHRVIVLDHRDCGAYRVLLGEDLAPNPAHELMVHAGTLRTLRDQIKARHSTLAVELLLMDLKGKVETVT